MLIKKADDKTKDIEILQGLLGRPDATGEVKKKIEQEIRNIQSGAKGEAEAAYEMNFYFGASKNWAIIHDLRVEHKGRVAQIDHLVINRFLEIWVCESKRFADGIAINEHGECAMFWNGRPQGIGSPYEQNAKHIAVIRAVCDDGAVELPKRLGFSINPTFSGLVIVSKNARISRPKSQGWWTEGIVKADAVLSSIEKTYDAERNPLTLAKVIGPDTLEDFATRLAALHVPVAFNWHAKFGFSDTPSDQPKPVQAKSIVVPDLKAQPEIERVESESAVPAEPAAQSPEAKKSKLVCSSCGTPVQYNVAKFCWFNKGRFGGKVYCYDCQKSVSPPATA
jgi:hypothetical protein